MNLKKFFFGEGDFFEIFFDFLKNFFNDFLFDFFLLFLFEKKFV